MAPNNSSSELRGGRGGDLNYGEHQLNSRGIYDGFDPSGSFDYVGFRVASVPEPSSAMLMIGSGLMFLLRRPSRFFPM